MNVGDTVEMNTNDEGFRVGTRGTVIETENSWCHVAWPTWPSKGLFYKKDGSYYCWIPDWKLRLISPLILLAECSE